jgi:hypothetical protein
MRRQLNLLVAPLSRSIVTRDQTSPMDSTKVAVYEGVSALGLIRSPVTEPEMPLGVLGPGVSGQEGVFLVGAGLNLSPVAIENVLAASMRRRARAIPRLLTV